MFHTMLRCYLISRNMYQMMRGSRYSIPGIRLFDIELDAAFKCCSLSSLHVANVSVFLASEHHSGSPS